jgi:hypothetical protein
LATFSGAGGSIEDIRSRNWIAIAVATVLMMFSYFTYAAAFIEDDGGDDGLEPALLFIGLAIAPFVFIAVAFISQNALAPKRVLQAMGLFLVVALSFGLIDPLVGAAAAYCLGGALSLNRPEVERVMRWRLGAVLFTTLYILVLLVVVPPAGVFAGGIVPLMMIGFADEYAAWSASRTPAG